MRQVLLAIDGETPTRAVFQYATELCQQVRAELRILQFIEDSQRLLLTPKRLKSRGSRQGKAFTAAAGEGSRKADELLCEVSGPLKKLLADQPGKVPFKLALSAETPERGLSDYVDTHHDIILTVFDQARDRETDKKKKTLKLDRLKKTLGVPLVVVKQ